MNKSKAKFLTRELRLLFARPVFLALVENLKLKAILSEFKTSPGLHKNPLFSSTQIEGIKGLLKRSHGDSEVHWQPPSSVI